MKNRITLILSALCIALSANANEEQNTQGEINYKPPIGWQFYNLPKPKKEQPKLAPLPQDQITKFDEMTASQQLEFLQQKMKEARDKAIMTGSSDDIAVYKVYQDYFVKKSSVFSAKWEKMLLDYPELDYNIENPHYNSAAPIMAQKQRKDEKDAIDYVNERYGIFFFYRGNESLDNKLAESVKAFTEIYNMQVVPISIDGKVSPEYPSSRFNAGQAERMGIKYFPALFLVDPKTGNYQPLSYGFLTQDDLARRVLNVVTDFKPKK